MKNILKKITLVGITGAFLTTGSVVCNAEVVFTGSADAGYISWIDPENGQFYRLDVMLRSTDQPVEFITEDLAENMCVTD